MLNKLISFIREYDMVQPGDTLWDIARHYRMALQDILSMNPELTMQPATGTPVITYRR